MLKVFCKHKSYIIIECKKDKTIYTCQCTKCKTQFTLPKAVNEMYEVGQKIQLL